MHKWRAEEQAILVGTNTVLQDNPSLTVRDWTGLDPIKVVIDKDLKLPHDLTVFNSNTHIIILCENRDKQSAIAPIETKPTVSTSNSEFKNITHSSLDWSKKSQIAQQICEVLFKKNINSIIIEGGTQTLQTFINEGLWDEAQVFTGATTFKNGIKAPLFKGQLIFEKNITDDTLRTYVNN